MTQFLEQAYAKIAMLSETEQDAIAELILEELEDIEEWERQFAESADLLAKLGQEALDEYRAGKTEPLPVLRTNADYRAAIDQQLAEIQRLRALMDEDQNEIDRLGAETRAILDEIKRCSLRSNENI